MKFRFLPSSQISGRMYNTVVSIKCLMWKVCRSPTLCRSLQPIIGLISNERNRVRWVILGLSEDGTCTDLSENSSVNSLNWNLSNATMPLPTHLFSHWSMPLKQYYAERSLHKYFYRGFWQCRIRTFTYSFCTFYKIVGDGNSEKGHERDKPNRVHRWKNWEIRNRSLQTHVAK